VEPALQDKMLPRSPYRGPQGGVDIGGLCSLLDFDQSTLAKMIGVSRQAVSQQLKSKSQFVRPKSPAARKFLEDLNHVVDLLLALTDGSNSEEEIRLWLHSPNKALDRKAPIDLIKARNLAPLRRALMDAITAAHGS